MEIIHQGTKDLATCGKCGSQMRYNALDVKLRHAPRIEYYDELEPEDHYVAYITCPVCQTSINVKSTGSQRKNLMDLELRRDHDL